MGTRRLAALTVVERSRFCNAIVRSPDPAILTPGKRDQPRVFRRGFRAAIRVITLLLCARFRVPLASSRSLEEPSECTRGSIEKLRRSVTGKSGRTARGKRWRRRSTAREKVAGTRRRTRERGKQEKESEKKRAKEVQAARVFGFQLRRPENWRGSR